jgi:hypothetical protein
VTAALAMGVDDAVRSDPIGVRSASRCANVAGRVASGDVEVGKWP